MSLSTVPQEVLEHIAFFSATETFLGPPSAILPLLSTSRRINAYLSIGSNPVFFARVFAHKFDVPPIVRRLGAQATLPAVLSNELQRRCSILKRIRARLDSMTPHPSGEENQETLEAVLWVAYLMMLENDGKNERQLREYAFVDQWLQEYWFDDYGASLAKSFMRADRWPPNNRKTSLAMWLFWFLLRPDDYTKNDVVFWNVTATLKILALGAHQYNLVSPSWMDFVPRPVWDEGNVVHHYARPHHLTPPPLATPAILAFLALINKISPFSGSIGIPATHTALGSPDAPQSQEWECEWERCLSLGQGNFTNIHTEAFKPGSIEGVWEGIFTYTEFTAYAALLAGAPPQTLQKSLVVQHRQTWKLREHHLLSSDSCGGGPLPAGDPLRSYFPTGTELREDADGVTVREPTGSGLLQYHRANGHPSAGRVQRRSCVQDIIITGEGHSAWGQFNLVGRVRPCDGFISISKEYVDGDRGKWLYRGYLVGDVNGQLAGRWRDTLSPPDVPGYEGCFNMSRRR